jgi:hypothetical protein
MAKRAFIMLIDLDDYKVRLLDNVVGYALAIGGL